MGMGPGESDSLSLGALGNTQSASNAVFKNFLLLTIVGGIGSIFSIFK